MGASTPPAAEVAPSSTAPRSDSWRGVHVALAALAMVATLPGRTHGLGLFTEPILHSLHLDKESYGFLNLWATLFGGLFCIPFGWLMDRLGTRLTLAGVTLALGTVVLVGSGIQGLGAFPIQVPLPWNRDGAALTVVFMTDLFILLLLTRGLGQSALSVGSLTLIGRSSGRRTGLAMGTYACLTALGFVAAFAVLRQVIDAHKNDPTYWREPWAAIGVGVLVAGVLFALLVRNRVLDGEAGNGAHAVADAEHELSRTLGQSLRHPAFWTFSVSISFFGMVSSGTSLFNESILQDLHFDKTVFLNMTLLAIPIGLASNLFGGWLATRLPLARVLAVAMTMLGLTLFCFPRITSESQVYVYTSALAAAGGVIAVCFYTAWRKGFGPGHLGKIQGAAQMITVLFSGLGPVLFGSAKERLGTYLPLFPWLAAGCLFLALMTWLAGLPNSRRA